MSQTRPTISVIIPAYNAERYLAESIQSAFDQTVSPTEIIVVNDGSTDQTADIARQFDVTLIQQENQGISGARNTGVRYASGECVAFLDADDLWTESKTERQLKALGENPQAQMVFGWVQQFISPDVEDQLKATIACPEQPMTGYVAGAMLLRRETFLQIGYFEPKWVLGEFIDWYAKAIEHGFTGLMQQEVVLKRRIHGTNQTIRHRDVQRDYVRVLKASLDRRRKAGTV